MKVSGSSCEEPVAGCNAGDCLSNLSHSFRFDTWISVSMANIICQHHIELMTENKGRKVRKLMQYLQVAVEQSLHESHLFCKLSWFTLYPTIPDYNF